MPHFNSKTGAEWGRVGGTVRTSRLDPSDLARTGQKGLLARFEREVDPDGTLDPAERQRRALRLRKAHMLRLNILRTQKRRATQAGAKDHGDVECSTPPRQKPLEWLTDNLARRPEGDRNSFLFWATCSALEEAHDPETVANEMYQAAIDSGLEVRETKTTIASAFKTVRAKFRRQQDDAFWKTHGDEIAFINARKAEGMSLAQAFERWNAEHPETPWWEEAAEAVDPNDIYANAAALLPPPPPEGSVFEHAYLGLMREAVRSEWKRSRDLSAIAESKTPPFITLAATREMETTDEDYVVADGILTRGGKLMLYAYAGHGKTTLLDSLAASLASGKPFLGAHAIDRAHTVLFVQGELTASEIASHGQDLLEHFNGTDAEGNLVFWRNTQLPLPQAEKALRDAIIETRATILILDPFNRFFRGDNSMQQEQVGEVFRMVDRLMEDEELGLDASIISHHANVSRARMAGTYDFEGWPSTILKLEVISPLLTTRKLTFEKIRAPRSTLYGSVHTIDLTDVGYVYAGGTQLSIPFAGPFLVAKALGELGGQALRTELHARTMAIANVKSRAAAGYIADAARQRLIEKLPDLTNGRQAVYRLPDQTKATTSDED